MIMVANTTPKDVRSDRSGSRICDMGRLGGVGVFWEGLLMGTNGRLQVMVGTNAEMRETKFMGKRKM